MSITLTLTANQSVFTSNYFPPIDLKGDYVCGLIDFQTYNSIPNIDESNNKFHIENDVIEIPTGSYEISDIEKCIQLEIRKRNIPAEVYIRPNNNTLQVEIKSTANIFFDKNGTIGTLLGFSSRRLEANVLHVSDLPVDIIKVNVIRIECNIISGSYINNEAVHTLHEFSPTVGPGYKIIETPKNVIYFPVIVNRLSSVTIKLVDQNGDIVNFRGENITLRLHLKPKHDYLQ